VFLAVNERFLTEPEIEALHAIQLAMLCEFVRVCDVLGLHYHLAAGTLLGAIRHKGFVPWDDDIDVAMPRRDYDRFLKEAPALLNAEIFLQHWRSDPGFSALFAKLRRNGSEFKELGRHRANQHHGIYIDIFPFDAVEPGRWWGRFHIRLVAWTNVILAIANHDCQGRLSTKRPTWQRLLGPPAYWIMRILPQSWLLQIQERAMTALTGYAANYVTCLATLLLDRSRADMLVRDISELCDTMLVTFAGHEFNVPVAFDSVLRRLYGNYWELPRETDRRPRHRVSAFRLP
jgi:lipopolysaccharide cholinephosphotransferase